MTVAKPLVVAVSGVKNSGKTTLIEAMLPLLEESGLTVAVVKHDGHSFDAEWPPVRQAPPSLTGKSLRS